MTGEDPNAKRFEWPPRRLPESELNAPAQPLNAGARHRVLSRSRGGVDDDAGWSDPAQLNIDWGEPEHQVETDDAEGGPGVQQVAHPEMPVAASPVRGIRRWMEAFEIAYLGRVSASWDVRARDAAWSADEDGTYCPRCGLAVGEFALDTLTDPPTCPTCRDRTLTWDRFVRLGTYEGVLASAIRELKFHAMRAHGERLGALLGERIAAELQALGVGPDEAAIVPVPMTPWRRIARGVDHTDTIARAASRASRVRLMRVLWRRHRPTQWSVPTSERRRNVAGSFGVRGGGWNWWGGSGGVERLRRCRVVVVLDDVRTTGATLTEACRVLGRALDGAEAENSPIIIASAIAVARVGGQQGP